MDGIIHMLAALVEGLVQKLPRGWLIVFVLSLVVGTTLLLAFFISQFAQRA